MNHNLDRRASHLTFSVKGGSGWGGVEGGDVEGRGQSALALTSGFLPLLSPFTILSPILSLSSWMHISDVNITTKILIFLKNVKTNILATIF